MGEDEHFLGMRCSAFKELDEFMNHSYSGYPSFKTKNLINYHNIYTTFSKIFFDRVQPYISYAFHSRLALPRLAHPIRPAPNPWSPRCFTSRRRAKSTALPSSSSTGSSYHLST